MCCCCCREGVVVVVVVGMKVTMERRAEFVTSFVNAPLL